MLTKVLVWSVHPWFHGQDSFVHVPYKCVVCKDSDVMDLLLFLADMFEIQEYLTERIWESTF